MCASRRHHVCAVRPKQLVVTILTPPRKKREAISAYLGFRFAGCGNYQTQSPNNAEMPSNKPNSVFCDPILSYF